MQKFSGSFLKDCTNYVQIGDSSSESWSVTSGSGQGRRLSPDYFNLASLSQAILCIISDFFGYADDGIDIVHGTTAAECEMKLRSVVIERVDWYKRIGLSLNISKTEILGIGFTPSPLAIDGYLINPTNKLVFLGTTIQSDLKWSSQVTSLCNKIRSAAGRIRSEGRNFCVRDKRSLYMAWIQSLIHFNASVILPIVSATELAAVQTASNAGIRAVVGLPKFGYADISALRAELKIQSVDSIIEFALLGAAWKKFSDMPPAAVTGTITRSMSNRNRPHPDQRGHMAKTSTAILTKAWNRIPLAIKNSHNLKTAKAHLKTLLY